MTDEIERIKSMYREGLREHGDSPAALLTPKGRSELRFRALDPFLRPGLRVLDYGCGLAYLLKHLRDAGHDVDYTGVDLLPEFVDASQKKFPDARFFAVGAEEPLGALVGTHDVVFASGVFNLMTHADAATSKAYAFARIEELFSLAREALVCDFLSAFVDFQQPHAQHFSVDEVATMCVARLGRRFQIRHDLLPYEMTLVAWRNSGIRRPQNVFDVDA